MSKPIDHAQKIHELETKLNLVMDYLEIKMVKSRSAKESFTLDSSYQKKKERKSLVGHPCSLLELSELE